MGSTPVNLIGSFYANLQYDYEDFCISANYPETTLDSVRKGFDWILSQHALDPLFALRTLPSIGKAIEKAVIGSTVLELPAGSIPIDSTGSTVLPEPFHGLFACVFHGDGTPSADFEGSYKSLSFKLLRQVFLAFSKVKDAECIASEEEEITNFYLRITSKPTIGTNPMFNSEVRVARTLLSHVLGDSEHDRPNGLCAELAQWDTIPFGKHGPGAVCGKEQGARKWDFESIPGMMEDIFQTQPGDPVMVPYSRYGEQKAATLGYSRLAIVPKDFRKHRLICIEPKELMFAQQGLMQVITQRVHAHPLARKAIDFRRQGLSQRLCRNDSFATIDLADASDRLSVKLARLLLPRDAFKLLCHCRSRGILLGDRVVDNYQTLFTMGNALCFPIETLVFWSLSLAAMITRDLGGQLEKFYADPIGFAAHYRLRVFGDDIIVPKWAFEDVCLTLENAGFVVNAQKSCSDTPIREACGAYWYSGDDVTITRFQYQFLANPLVWISWLENSRELYNNGFYKSADVIHNILDKQFSAPRHFLNRKVLIDGTTYRYNWDLQRVEYCVPVPVKDRSESLRGHYGLYAWFTGQATLGNIPNVGLKTTMEWKPADGVVTPMTRQDVESEDLSAENIRDEVEQAQEYLLLEWKKYYKGSNNSEFREWMARDLFIALDFSVEAVLRKIAPYSSAAMTNLIGRKLRDWLGFEGK